MASILKLVFAHKRPEMLDATLKNVGDAIVLGEHEGWDGKRMFWHKFQTAVDIALRSQYDWFWFLPDDFTDHNVQAMELFTRQGWENHLVAINTINDGRTQCWGAHDTGQKPIEIAGITLKETGFVDCSYLTNRHTLKGLKIEEPLFSWWTAPDKSSGVGYQNTMYFRSKGVKMMTPTPSLAKHGAHESVMHGEHRKQTPLISK